MKLFLDNIKDLIHYMSLSDNLVITIKSNSIQVAYNSSSPQTLPVNEKHNEMDIVQVHPHNKECVAFSMYNCP